MILCLGEAIVDLVCEGEVASLAEAPEFRPHPGGALANVAVAASRAGASAALAGGAGDDEWGRWLCDRLEAEGVDLRFFTLVGGPRTPVAFIGFDSGREPTFLVYGEGIGAGLASLDGHLGDALAKASALVLGSNTLVNDTEREVTLKAWRAAIDSGIPVLFDPNLRRHRWRDLDTALGLCRDMCAGALVVRTNLEEGLWLAGLEADAGAERAAEAILALGARVAVVTRGGEGAIMRGAARAEHPGVAVDLVSPLGAGDAFMGTLAAGLAQRGFEAGRADETLAPACEAAAQTCTVWRAVE